MGVAAKKYLCPCCEQITLEEPDNYDVCLVCGWEDDDVQHEDPNYEGGANTMSLNQAKKAYANGEPVA